MIKSNSFINYIQPKLSPKPSLKKSISPISLSRQTTDTTVSSIISIENENNIYMIKEVNGEIRLATNKIIKSITLENTNPNIILANLCDYHNKTMNNRCNSSNSNNSDNSDNNSCNGNNSDNNSDNNSNNSNNSNILLDEFIDYVFFGNYSQLIEKNELFKIIFKNPNNYVLKYKYLIMQNEIVINENNTCNNSPINFQKQLY